jgi:signal transduction histidine kinase
VRETLGLGGRARWAAAPVVVAATLAVFALAEALANAVGVPPPPGATDRALHILVFCLLALGTTVPLALLRTQPVVAAVAVSAMVLLSLTAFETVTAAGVCAQLITGFRLGRAGHRVLALLLAAPFVLFIATDDLSSTSPVGQGTRLPAQAVAHEPRLLLLLLAVLAPAAALAGIAWRSRSEAREHQTARQVVAETLVEHTARGERARIARELHDVVAHHISMVAVQAETARLTTPGMPSAGAERLSAIGDTARAALTEMRRLLGVLREDAEADAADRRPQPGLRLDELNALLDESRDASGTATRLVLRGAPVVLDPGVELAAYRIIQEALTNARRHAPGAAVDVELHYTGDTLRLAVRDNGPGPSAAAPPGGHGLSGMRERATAVGGELRTGPAPGGGFLIEAHLPGVEAGLPGAGSRPPEVDAGLPGEDDSDG